MANYVLKQYWRGIPSVIIGENLETKATAVEVDVMVASERERIENDALDGIIKRAKAGELDAVTWLDERGFIDLSPGNKYEYAEADSES